MTTLAEQVAGLKVGDWIEARYVYGDEHSLLTGRLVDDVGTLIVVDKVIRYDDGQLQQNLTSITRVPRPIPQEPEYDSYAFLDDENIAKRFAGGHDQWFKAGSEQPVTWLEIYPHIVRLYTPSGELVTDFEYAEQVGER